jgi:hypothetical protein
MAGPAMRTDRLTVLREALIAKVQGASDDAVAKHKVFSEELYAGLIAAKTDDEALSIARTSVAQAAADNLLPADAAEATVQQVTSLGCATPSVTILSRPCAN